MRCFWLLILQNLSYFARLIGVDSLEDRMDVDNLLERVNQIFLVHCLLLKNH